jgi:hypothetical protein
MLTAPERQASDGSASAEDTRAVVRGYNDTWVRGDISGSASYLDRDDFHWDGGAFSYDDVDRYIEGFEQFTIWRGEQRILSELYGAGEAMLFYQIDTPAVGTLRGVEHFVVRNGKISRITLVWDPTTVREFQARQRAAAPGGAA